MILLAMLLVIALLSGGCDPAISQDESDRVEFASPVSADTEARALAALDTGIALFFAKHPSVDRARLRSWHFLLHDDSRFLVNRQTGDFGFVQWGVGLTEFSRQRITLAIWPLPGRPGDLVPALEWELENVFGLGHS